MSGPTRFKVLERLGPVGTLSKLPIDFREATLDFTQWLASDEMLVSVAQHGIVANPAEVAAGSWSLAFCCGSGCVAADPPPADTNPLVVFTAAVVDYNIARLIIGQGTAGLTYGVSFLATVSPTQRRKAVDLVVCVGTPMVDIMLPTPPPPPLYQFINSSTSLVEGSSGTIYVNNTTLAPINVQLPPLPNIDQNLIIKDTAGNAETYPITVVGNIDGITNMTLRSNFSWIELKYNGVHWMQV